MTLNIAPPEDTYTELVAVEDISDVDVEDTAGGTFVDKKLINSEAEQVEATNLVKRVSNVPTKSVEFKDVIAVVENYGSDAIRKSADTSNRILERSSTSQKGAKKSGNSNQMVVANTLGELREMVDELAPKDLSVGKKILGFIPGNRKVTSYFRKYESAQEQLSGIMNGLSEGSDSLLRDNADIRVEQGNMWTAIQELSKSGRVIKDMDDTVSKQIEQLRYEGKTEEAKTMDADLLNPIRQRRQDLTTQLAVSVQSYMSLGLIEQNNKELIKGVRRAKETTMMALRNAVLTAEAMAGQQLVLDKIDGLNTTTNNLIKSNAQQLKINTARIHEQASSSGISAEALEASFSALEETMNAIDNYKASANIAMEQSTNRLQERIEQTKSFVERARKTELSNGGQQSQSSIGR